jgi:tRNA (uracil-5-)-methyltransferase TRM9
MATDVIGVYNIIASEFSHTRYKPWPCIEEFIDSLEPGSKILDAGCGNGRNMLLRDDCTFVGFDASSEMVKICQERSLNVKVGSIVDIPHEDNEFDAVMTIAVVHHLKTQELRVKAIQELSRVTKVGGKIFILVWNYHAITPKKFHPIDEGDDGDYMVTWTSKKEPEKVHNRFYHMYNEDELENEVSQVPSLSTIDSFEEKNNFGIMCTKTNVIGHKRYTFRRSVQRDIYTKDALIDDIYDIPKTDIAPVVKKEEGKEYIDIPMYDRHQLHILITFNNACQWRKGLQIKGLGTLFRTIIMTLYRIPPYNLHIIIDLSNLAQIKPDTFYNHMRHMEWTSTTSSVFANISVIMRKDQIPKENPEYLNCYQFIEVTKSKTLFGDREEYYIGPDDIRYNSLQYFDMDDDYLKLWIDDFMSATKYSTLFYQIHSGHNFEKIERHSRTLTLLICSNSFDNVRRIINMIEYYQKVTYDVIKIRCLTDDNHVYDDITSNIKINVDFSIMKLNEYLTTDTHELTGTVIAIDIGDKAETLCHGTGHFNGYGDTTMIFGFEHGGIPKELLGREYKMVQLRTRKSLNIVNATIIFVYEFIDII